MKTQADITAYKPSGKYYTEETVYIDLEELDFVYPQNLLLPKINTALGNRLSTMFLIVDFPSEYRSHLFHPQE